MDQLTEAFKKHSLSNNVSDVDSICHGMSNAVIEYDERKELFECIDMKFIGEEELLRTDERYTRYIKYIYDWEINGVSYEYIRDNIYMYLSMKTNEMNLMKKIMLMNLIDNQIKNVIGDV